MAEELVSLTKGSRYRVESMETRDRTKITKGIFRGYATIGPDEAIVLELDESHQEMKGKLRFGKVNVDEQPEVAEKFEVASIPTIYIFKDGKVIANRVGAATKEVMKEWINSSVR